MAAPHDAPASRPVAQRTLIHHGKVFDVVADRVDLGGQAPVVREYTTHPGAVAVIALDDEDRVLLLSQYRHPVRRELWETPAGLLDVPGEHPLSAARRELYEEAHVQAEDWRVLVDIYSSPGGSDEAIRVFLARGLSDAEGERFDAAEEEAEFEHARVGLAELVRGVLAGELHNSCLAVGVLALQAVLNGDGPEALRPADAPWPARPYTA